MAKLVVFESSDEVLITTKKNRKRLIKEYFKDGGHGGRDLADYDVSYVDSNEIMEISNRMRVDVY